MTPILFTTLRDYSGRAFVADLIAGLTVALVALPLSLAIAIASGATPEKGMITAIVGGFMISALGGSRVQIGGPTAAFIVVVFGVIAEHGYDGLVLATLMAGAILAVAGYLKVGSLIRYVPEPVISGFTIGIAIVIATSQIKDFLGLTVKAVPADFMEKLPVLWAVRDTLNIMAVGIGLGTAILIVLLRRTFPRFPGLIVAISVMSMLCAMLALPVDTIASRFGALPNHLPLPHLPDMSVARLVSLLPSALTIAFLAGVESLLSAMVADRLTADKHRPNAEIIAQGYANIASSFFGGMPATGAIARTATNIRAGAVSPVSGMIHALVILAIMVLFSGLAGYLAMPALAALLILTAWNMAEPDRWRDYLRMPRADLLLLLVTLVLTILTDLTVAIAVGIGLGLAMRLRKRDAPYADWHTPDR